ncbi:MAG: hypothetical protein J0L69_09120 [Bacteroidetes bacterium]|nr:hypothetical protein [Bacteroidota bacterium]
MALIKSIFLYYWMLMHPYYLSVTELKYNTAEKSMAISCKMFTNDLEDAIKRSSGKTTDLLNPKDKKEVDKQLAEYISKRLKISIDGKACSLKYLGYEKEEDCIWTYLEIEKIAKPKNLKIETTLLYDFLKEQINIVHVEVDNYKESSKVSNPDSKMEFKLP